MSDAQLDCVLRRYQAAGNLPARQILAAHMGLPVRHLDRLAAYAAARHS